MQETSGSMVRATVRLSILYPRAVQNAGDPHQRAGFVFD